MVALHRAIARNFPWAPAAPPTTQFPPGGDKILSILESGKNSMACITGANTVHSGEDDKMLPQSGILDLPTELHHMIVDCAPASTAVNLELTCRHLFQCGTPLTILYNLVRKDPDLRFDMTCIDERKFKRHGEKVACSGCRTFTTLKFSPDTNWHCWIGNENAVAVRDASDSLRTSVFHSGIYSARCHRQRGGVELVSRLSIVNYLRDPEPWRCLTMMILSTASSGHGCGLLVRRSAPLGT